MLNSLNNCFGVTHAQFAWFTEKIVSSFNFSTDIQNYDSSQTHFSIKVPYSFIPSFSVVLWSCQVNKIKLTNEFHDWSHLFVFLNLKRIMIKKNLQVIDIVLIYSFGSVNSQFSYWFLTFYNANKSEDTEDNTREWPRVLISKCTCINTIEWLLLDCGFNFVAAVFLREYKHKITEYNYSAQPLKNIPYLGSK